LTRKCEIVSNYNLKQSSWTMV